MMRRHVIRFDLLLLLFIQGNFRETVHIIHWYRFYCQTVNLVNKKKSKGFSLIISQPNVGLKKEINVCNLFVGIIWSTVWALDLCHTASTSVPLPRWPTRYRCCFNHVCWFRSTLCSFEASPSTLNVPLQQNGATELFTEGIRIFTNVAEGDTSFHKLQNKLQTPLVAADRRCMCFRVGTCVCVWEAPRGPPEEGEP